MSDATAHTYEGVALHTRNLERQQLLAVANRVANDDRYTYTTMEYGDDEEGAQGGEQRTMKKKRTPVKFMLRTVRKTNIVKGDPLSMLMDTETIPQYLWPAAHPFAHWILHNRALFKGKRVLELGSGVGLGGLAAAEAGAAVVVLSDCSAMSLGMMLESCRRRDDEKATGASQQPSADGRVVTVAELKWGDEAAVKDLTVFLQQQEEEVKGGSADTLTGFSFDIVIGCDVFYFKPSLKVGLQTAKAALRQDGQGVFLCASFVRSERMDSDLAALPQEFGFSERIIEDGSLPPPPPIGSNATSSSAASAEKNTTASTATSPSEAALKKQQADVEHLRVFEWRLLE